MRGHSLSLFLMMAGALTLAACATDDPTAVGHDEKFLVECNGATIGAACDTDDTLCTDEVCQLVGADVTCLPAGNRPAGTACEADGDPCTADTCVAGTCGSAPLAVGTGCDDDALCTTATTCQPDGTCGGGAARICPDDGDSCTAESCQPDVGCVSDPVPAATPCDDGNGCTIADTCDASGACGGSAQPDGIPCAGATTAAGCAPAGSCVAGVCEEDLSSCDTPDAGPVADTDAGLADGAGADAGPSGPHLDDPPDAAGAPFAGDLGGGGCRIAAAHDSTDGAAGGIAVLLLVCALGLHAASRRPRHVRRAGVLVVLLLAGAAARPARAGGLDAQLFQPATSSTGYITQDGALVLPARHLDFGASLDFARDLLVMRDPDTGMPLDNGVIVASRTSLHLTAGFGLGGWLELGADLPLNLAQEGDVSLLMRAPDDDLATTTAGDLRFAAKARLGATGPLHFAAAMSLALPTGAADSFSGSGTPVLAPRLIAALEGGRASLALNLGYRLRGRSQVANLTLDDELTAGVAGRMTVVPGRLWLVGEGYLARGTQGDGAAREMPAEIDLGVRLALFGPWVLSGGVGVGIGHGYGAPSSRGILALAWSPSGAARRAGRPFVPAVDHAPRPRPAVATIDPERDTDALVDRLEWQADVAGGSRDSDGDGIIDAADDCPDEPETRNGKEDDDGCPDRLDLETPVRIIAWKNRLKTLPKVRFVLGKAPVRAESYAVLAALAAYLRAHPEIDHLLIAVHTDDRSNAARSLLRSQQRAENIRDYLVDIAGIAPERLDAIGFGPHRPLVANDTAQHRNWNRRVDYVIVKKKGSE